GLDQLPTRTGAGDLDGRGRGLLVQAPDSRQRAAGKRQGRDLPRGHEALAPGSASAALGPRALGDRVRTVAVCRWWGGKDWDRAAAVLAGSLRRHCPEWGQSFAELRHPPSSKLIGNSMKLASWADALDHLPNGLRVVLLDADLLVRAPLDSLWEDDF